jgi:hypothetical protein
MPLSFSKINELVKHDILIDKEVTDEDKIEMGLIN